MCARDKHFISEFSPEQLVKAFKSRAVLIYPRVNCSEKHQRASSARLSLCFIGVVRTYIYTYTCNNHARNLQSAEIKLSNAKPNLPFGDPRESCCFSFPTKICFSRFFFFFFFLFTTAARSVSFHKLVIIHVHTLQRKNTAESIFFAVVSTFFLSLSLSIDKSLSERGREFGARRENIRRSEKKTTCREHELAAAAARF